MAAPFGREGMAGQFSGEIDLILLVQIYPLKSLMFNTLYSRSETTPTRMMQCDLILLVQKPSEIMGPSSVSSSSSCMMVKGRVRCSTWRIRLGGFRAGDGVRRFTVVCSECVCVCVHVRMWVPTTVVMYKTVYSGSDTIALTIFLPLCLLLHLLLGPQPCFNPPPGLQLLSGTFYCPTFHLSLLLCIFPLFLVLTV